MYVAISSTLFVVTYKSSTLFVVTYKSSTVFVVTYKSKHKITEILISNIHVYRT
jgi:hypothetical protein